LQVNLASEGLVVAGVAINEIIEDLVRCPLVKSLVDENPDNGVGQLFYPVRPSLFEIAGDRPEQHRPRDVVTIRASLCSMPISEPLLPLLLPSLSLVVTLSCHVSLPFVMDGTSMVKGPADRRKPFVAATKSLPSESEFRGFESNERNLTRVERISKQVAGKPLGAKALRADAKWIRLEPPSQIRESKYCGLESLA
jgi:hypothetical protein